MALIQSAAFGVQETGQCGVCGRKLTNPKSVQAGIGPVCAGKGGGNDMQDDDRPYDMPIDRDFRENGLIMRRDAGIVFTNVPHYAVQYSPDGYEFGYGGSGPNDLALNAVHHLLLLEGYQGEMGEGYQSGQVFALAHTLKGAFLAAFIAGVDRHKGAEVPYERLRAWLYDYAGQLKINLRGGAE